MGKRKRNERTAPPACHEYKELCSNLPPSRDEYQKLCSAVYSDAASVPGWKRLCDHADTTTGFYGVAWTCGQHVVIAFRGTESMQDIITDADMLWKNKWQPRTAPHAWTLFEKARAKKDAHDTVSFTGHSLGGALAIVTACRVTREEPTLPA